MKVTRVKAARKDYPNQGIRKGETYYWWKFRNTGKIRSKTYPRRSQLTQSGFLSTLYDLEDEINDFQPETIDDLKVGIEDFVGQIEQLRDEAQESLDNMPEHLQETSDSGILLQERIDAMEQWQEEVEAILDNVEEPEDEEEEPEEPEDPGPEPERDDFDTDEEYEQAREEWEHEVEEYDTLYDQWEDEHREWEEAQDNIDHSEYIADVVAELQGTDSGI